MNKKLLALYGLKWNPFSPELPVEALRVTSALEDFAWRIEHSLVRDGGFALISGDVGTGKSVALRLLAERLAPLPDLTVAPRWLTPRPISPTSIASSVICSRWSCARTIAGWASRPCAPAGSPIS